MTALLTTTGAITTVAGDDLTVTFNVTENGAGFAAAITRRKVTPTVKVALTHDDVALLEASR